MSDVRIEKLIPADEEILEEWARVTSEPDLFGVSAQRGPNADWSWRVDVAVMELIRSEPLESELAAAVSATLAKVPGVKKAAREDRATWVIKGSADGPALVRAASTVVDRFASQTRKVLGQLESSE